MGSMIYESFYIFWTIFDIEHKINLSIWYNIKKVKRGNVYET